ncbi:MAG: adenylosuccinate synthetase [Pseudomonadota bacterium]
MPVSIVIGGQFGSEGKGKVALELVRQTAEADTAVVRVGGSNSGHTAYDKNGKRFALRQLPAGCIDRDVKVVFPPGFFVDLDLLTTEIEELDYPRDRIFISNFARIVTAEHKKWEEDAGLGAAIGSTGSGVGGAMMALVARGARNFPLSALSDAQHCEPLARYVTDTSLLLRQMLDKGQRVIVEGSQGFGLSLSDGGYWPKATSRGTTAAAALAETGLSPIDVDCVILVLRAFPIRVAGNSGPLHGETTWDEIASAHGLVSDIREFTTVTNRLRRVGQFDHQLVRRAITTNNPTHLALNHLDYIGNEDDLKFRDSKLNRFISSVEENIKKSIDFYGFSGRSMRKSAREFI